MRAWVTLFLPVVLLNVLVVFFSLSPHAAPWAAHASFRAIPSLVFGLVFTLGIFFTQTRISFLALFFGGITWALQHAAFGPGACESTTTALVFLSAIYVPPVTVLFYYLHESHMFTLNGAIRAAVIFSVLLVVVLLPEAKAVADTVAESKAVLFLIPVRSIPVVGYILCAAAVPFLLINHKRESLLGATVGAAMLFMMFALAFRCSIFWSAKFQHAGLILLSGMSGLTLAWAVLESSWRNIHIDELTELPGRRSLKHHMANLRDPYFIAVLDIDHFKKINDRYGHPTGDQVLRFLASHLRDNKAGKAYRFGGEEFVIVCEGGSLDEKVEALEALRKAISARQFWIRGRDRPKRRPDKGGPPQSSSRKTQQGVTVTVSIGVAAGSAKYASPQDVMEAADKALYRAKQDGRDRVKSAR